MKAIFLVFFGIVFGMGCARSSALPVHDEVLVYPLPLDLTYLRTLEAIQTHPDWNLHQTDKEKGVIQIHNTRYSSFADAEKREATLILKRVDSGRTSVQFDENSRAVVGGDEILDLIRQYLAREVSLRSR